MEIKKLAFLETYLGEDSSIMGVILVTDADTKPLEFRVTSQIKPTNFQKILYGNVLKEHILVELVALPLLGAIDEDIDVILVSDPLFLGINFKQDVRAVRVFSGKEASSRGLSKIDLSSFSNEGLPLSLEIPKQHEDELPGISEALEAVAGNRDLSEPFERLKLGCEQVYLKKTTE
jgi:hypothetical protein